MYLKKTKVHEIAKLPLHPPCQNQQSVWNTAGTREIGPHSHKCNDTLEGRESVEAMIRKDAVIRRGSYVSWYKPCIWN